MKNLKITMISFGIAALLTGFTSCTEDERTIPMDDTGTAATYRLTSVNVPTTPDLNGDLVGSANLMTETACYNDSFLRLNPNHTWRLQYNYALASGGAIECQDIITTGTWSRAENTITLGSFNDNNILYTISDSGTITRAITNSVYPGNNAAGGIAPQTGDVTLVYTRDAE